MPPIPTKKIPQLTAYGVPLAGAEMLEIWAVNTSRRVTARDFVLPIDSLVTLTGMGGTLPGSRQLISSPTIQVTDNGAGNTVQLDALGAGALPDNPTALVGLTPVNGVAVTWMRSDAAPALDQGIVPTWTGDHTFTANQNQVVNAVPNWFFVESDAAADNRAWVIRISGEQFNISALNDLGSVVNPWVTVDRTAAVIDTVNLQATTVQVNGQNVRDAAILTSGTIATARLGSGVADATSWLRGDQTWQVLPGGFTGFANPTALVGLAAVNGVATTAMRSDAAPALDQGITPTWTAQHIFGLSGATNAAVLASSAQPQVDWNETDAAANNRRWRWEAQGEQFLGRVVDDANSAAVTWVAVDRTLNVVDTIALTSTALTWNGNPLLSTGTAFANPTGTVGLAAVNGVATTAMRSDAAPALSQAIAPTWTAQHTFAFAGSNATPTVLLSSASPTVIINETDAAVDNRRWKLEVDGERFLLSALNDANTVNTVWLQVDRTGTTVDSITFPSGVALFTANATDPAPNILAQNIRPNIQLWETDAGANSGRWSILASVGTFSIRTLDDAAGAGTNMIQFSRSGTTPTNVAFPTTTTGSFFVGTGSSFLTGGVAQILAPAAIGCLYLKNVSNGAFTGAIWNADTVGNNALLEFATEAAYTGRGSIAFSRGAGLISYNTTSDARRKKNIVDAPEASDIIDNIRVRSFDWKDSDVHLDHWLVAQELYGVVPMAVTKGDGNRDWAVDPAKLVPLLVKELQSVRRRLAEVESSIH